MGMRTSTVLSAPRSRLAGSTFIWPATRPDFASRTTNVTEGWAGSPSLRSLACTRTHRAARSGEVCTCVKCGVPERINSTESKMPGMYRSFSKSNPDGIPGPTASRSAPTRTSNSFSPTASTGFALK